MKLNVIFLLAMLPALSVKAEDWTTTDGKVYQNVTVLKVEPDAVTIIHKDGGGLVALDKLPTDLQKRFNYNPVKAKAAADQRVSAERAAQTSIENERVTSAQRAKEEQDKKQEVENAKRLSGEVLGTFKEGILLGCTYHQAVTDSSRSVGGGMAGVDYSKIAGDQTDVQGTFLVKGVSKKLADGDHLSVKAYESGIVDHITDISGEKNMQSYHVYQVVSETP